MGVSVLTYCRNSFHKAAEAMRSLSHLQIATFLADNIILAHKFILPDAGKMTEGKPFDHYKDALNLPFPRVALLREVDMELQGSRVRTQQICVAVARDHVESSFTTPAAFYVADCTRVPWERNVWSPSAPVGIEILKSSGVQMWRIRDADEEERLVYGHVLHDANSGFGPLNGLLEMLLLLSLKNVGTQKIVAPRALNASRIRRGRLPLYDYHVLVIDGHTTYDERRSDESDRAIRSHFRRGHIRRISEDRRIWVRATMVRGSAPGFVDKDYDLRADHA